MRSRSLILHELAGISVIALLLAGVLGWSTQTTLNGAVIAAGKIADQQISNQLQHPDGGLIKALNVSEGEYVRSGDSLILLDKTHLEARIAIMETAILELSIEQARLEAERDNNPGLDPPAFVTSFAAPETYEKSLAAHTRLHTAIQNSIKKKVEQLKNQISQAKSGITGIESRLSANADQIRLAEDELEVLADLRDKHLVKRDRIMAMERDLSALRGQKGELLSNIARLKTQISETELKILELYENRRTRLLTRLGEVQSKLAQLQEQFAVERENLRRAEISAPISGYVHDLKFQTPGGVIGAGDVIMTIVSEAKDLIFEVRVRPQDIDSVHMNQKVKLRFSTLSASVTPEILGAVSMIAADQSVDSNTKLAYYKVQIQSSPSELEQVAEFSIRHGMPVEAFIITGERTVLSYLMKPFTDRTQKAFRD